METIIGRQCKVKKNEEFILFITFIHIVIIWYLWSAFFIFFFGFPLMQYIASTKTYNFKLKYCIQTRYPKLTLLSLYFGQIHLQILWNFTFPYVSNNVCWLRRLFPISKRSKNGLVKFGLAKKGIFSFDAKIIYIGYSFI